jgi:ribonuclease HII
MAGRAKILADFTFEEAALAAGERIVCGVDEVGRGPLAGPVVAAAVVLDGTNLPPDLADSKAMSAKRREAAFEAIVACASAISLVSLPAPVIDHLNIRAASLHAMTLAVRGLALQPDLALIDGNALPDGLPCQSEALVKGDARSFSIAAASIVAKVTRDRMMREAHKVWPAFGFNGHKGYPTEIHRKTLMKAGPTPLHRRSFAPVRVALAKNG